MFTARESQMGHQLSASNSPELNYMASLHLTQNYSLPSFHLPTFTTNIAFPDLRGLNTGPQNDVGGFSKLGDFSYPTENPYLKDSQFGLINKPTDVFCVPQKKFLIFDQSGNHTRLFISPSFSPQDQIIASKAHASGTDLCVKVSARLDQHDSNEKCNENHFNDVEGDTLEDTEEINALLYSDSDDEYDDDDDGDDEVTSTGHTPFSIQKGLLAKNELLEELIEEVASSDGSPKRRKLLDGRFKKSSLVMVESPVKQASSCIYGNNDIDSSKKEKKVKIFEALKKLEGIIPGLKNNDPLTIIDNAIVYLETMKNEAEILGLS